MRGEKRPDGYYWVNFRGDVAPRRICNGKVIVGVVLFRASEVDEIGLPCNRDDAEQLAKAREVLRDIQKQSCKSGSIRSYVVNSIIDISGVRL